MSQFQGRRIAALHAARRPGCCLCCGAPLGPGHRTLCGSPECARTYRNAACGDSNEKRRRGEARRPWAKKKGPVAETEPTDTTPEEQC